MKLLAATRSSGKQRELQRLFDGSGWEVVFPEDLGLAPRPEEASLEESGTYEANARHKAEYFARLTRLPTIADDSGLEVFALGGAPGVRSKRFAGLDGEDSDLSEANNAELLRRLAGAPEAKRRARYVCAVAFVPRHDAAAKIYQGITTGRILEQPDGEGGFGYDPLFWSDDLAKPFGRATAEEKDSVSHRARAVMSFQESNPATGED